MLPAPPVSNCKTPWSACGGHGWWTKRRFTHLTGRTLQDSGYVALLAPEVQTRYAMAHREHEMTNSRSICHGQQRTRCWRGRRFCKVSRRALAPTKRRCHTQSEVPDRCGAGKACKKCVQRRLVRGTDSSLRIGPRKNQEPAPTVGCPRHSSPPITGWFRGDLFKVLVEAYSVQSTFCI